MRLRALTRLRGVLPAPSERDWPTLLTYVTAAVVYIGIGVWLTDVLLSVFVAAAYVVFAAWVIPTLLDRIR